MDALTLLPLLLFVPVFGLWRKPKKVTNAPNAGSIVIACRNEQDNLPRLFESIDQLDTNGPDREVIFVDDASTDTTAPLLRKYCERRGDARIITLQRAGSTGGKKRALTAGINATRFPVILCTDADCTLPPNWLRAHLALYDDDTGMVVGPVLEAGNRDDQLGRIISSSLITGMAGAGFPYSASGGNLSFRRSLFHKAGGFRDVEHLPAGADKWLVRLVRKTGFSIKALPDCVVRTHSDPGQAQHRLLRRYGKSRMSSPGVQVLSLLSAFALGLLPLSIFSRKYRHLPLVYGLSAMMFLKLSSRRFREPVSVPLYLLVPLYPYKMLFYSVLSMIRTWRWKE